MRRISATIALLLAPLAAPTAAHAAPDLRACPELEQADTSERLRTMPLKVPRAVAAIVRSNMDHYAVSTLAGGTVCIDTRFIEDTEEDHTLSRDKRFLSFTWSGYEAGGYVLVDRSGSGQVVETGAEPTFSPSRKRLAAVEWSESGFGSLNGFAVWQVDAAGLTQLALLEDIPGMVSWRIDRWAGEDCIELSGVPFDEAPDDPRELGDTLRKRFAARTSRGTWTLTPSPAGCDAS